MKQLLLLIFILANFYVLGQETLKSHDFVKGNIPAYKPTFNENFPNWAKQLYQEEVNFHEIKKDYEEWKKLDKKPTKPLNDTIKFGADTLFITYNKMEPFNFQTHTNSLRQ